MKYRYYNANPFGNNVEDCTVRAISLVENKPYRQTYHELSEYALNRGLMMSSVESIEKYLDSKYKRVCFKGKTLKDFINEHPYGKYLITMPNHITAVVNGTNYDSFRNDNKEIWCSWEVK